MRPTANASGASWPWACDRFRGLPETPRPQKGARGLARQSRNQNGPRHVPGRSGCSKPPALEFFRGSDSSDLLRSQPMRDRGPSFWQHAHNSYTRSRRRLRGTAEPRPLNWIILLKMQDSHRLQCKNTFLSCKFCAFLRLHYSLNRSSAGAGTQNGHASSGLSGTRTRRRTTTATFSEPGDLLVEGNRLQRDRLVVRGGFASRRLASARSTSAPAMKAIIPATHR